MTGVQLNPVQLDRAAGALVGLAAGDALGAGYEFESVVPDPPQMIGGGLGGWEPGEWTDDTQMAVCIAEVTAGGTLDLDAIAERFLEWFGTHPPDVGNQTRAVLGAARTSADLTQVAQAHFERNRRNAAGNGSLMRTAPVALGHLGDDHAIAEAAMSVSALTHGDPIAGEACVLWCIAIDRAVREGRLDGAIDGLDLLPARSRDGWDGLLRAAATEPPEFFTPNGFVVTALQAAYAAIVQTPVPHEMPCVHLQRALERAVRIGDDTDTVAAIAGQLLGARWGASAVPIEWRALLHGWPGYRSRDLSRLAILTARGGEPDAATGWPSAERLVPFYRSRDGATGRVVTLADDPGVRIGDAASVNAATGSDVVLSLCRMGRSDVLEGVEHHETWLIDLAGAEHNPNLEFILRDLAGAISGWSDQRRPVLVHCVRAESRTPTVAAAYLAERYGMSGADALARVREVLPGAHPNPGFRAALGRLWP
jgi:ADP-ribosylglycohydrolase